jgi:glycosyltransferase involved in cell wall biosynthesis
MNNDINFSIIVPVYNTQKYLHQCIDSVLNQSFKNFQLLLVDDGSIDLSGEICDEYAKADGRVQVIHKKNGGNTSARRAGINQAQGEYIGFVDSDDWIESDMYENLLKMALKSGADIVSSGYYRSYETSESLIHDDVAVGFYGAADYAEIISILIGAYDGTGRRMAPSMWCRIYRKSLIQRVIKGLPDIIQYGEDLYCTISAILKSKSIYVTHDAFYHYRINSSSIVHTRDENFFTKINNLFLCIRNEILNYPDYRDDLMKQLAYNITDSIIKGINYRFDFGVDISVPDYYLPTNILGLAKTVVLYGAGKVGKEYYRELKMHPEYKLTAWIDKNYEACNMPDIEIKPVESISQLEYDIVLLGTMYEGMADDMRKTLMEFGVTEDKIVWCQPRNGILVK